MVTYVFAELSILMHVSKTFDFMVTLALTPAVTRKSYTMNSAFSQKLICTMKLLVITMWSLPHTVAIRILPNLT